MTPFKVVSSIVVAVVLGVAIYGAYQYPVLPVLAGSPAGSSFATSKAASQVVKVSTSTVYAQLNSDGSDRIINGADLALSGGTSTTSPYLIQCATSTVATGFTPANTNYIYQNTIVAGATADPFGTTTTGYYLATTSPGITGTTTISNAPLGPYQNQFARRWKAGTYLVCELTTSVGSTANLLDANVTGTMSFPYRGQ